MKIAVAMSGGVDSTVAAALLRDEGHQVFGITMPVGGAGAVRRAQTAAGLLGIPHHTFDVADAFQQAVIDPFCAEYRRGRTPNPCVLCNRLIKLGVLLGAARRLGAERLATGHYARIEPDGNGRFLLKKGVDRRKDQSYFLYALSQEQLGSVLMPVGYYTRGQVRERAREIKAELADSPSSHEICFIPDNDHAAFLKSRIPEAAIPGAVKDKQGNVLGSHPGIIFYTVGQRRGLGIAAGSPLYVTGIRASDNTVIAGSREAVFASALIATGLNWISSPPTRQPFRAKVRIRYRHPEAAATISPLTDDTIHVRFSRPQWAITPGQAIVLYRGDTVIGGGTIDVVE